MKTIISILGGIGWGAVAFIVIFIALMLYCCCVILDKNKEHKDEISKQHILDKVTLEDCENEYIENGNEAVLSDGKLIGFTK
jgi:predicted nucleic acid-binding protein